jgi:hypothetical protein
MGKKAAFILLLTGIAVQFSHSQVTVKNSDPVLFRGVVMASQTLTRIAGSMIYVNRTASSVSKSDGTFSFYAFRKDTISFTSLGYKPAFLIVSDTLKAKEFLTGVYLQADTIEIGEVIIVPRTDNFKAELLNPRIAPNPKFENARSNVNIASYQGRTGQGKLGDPAINYEMIRQKQKIDAYERGGIPSDKMIGLNPLILLPAAYMLMKGLPEKPTPPEPAITQKELDELNRRYNEQVRNRK